jgi:hypothetical protein
VYTWLTNPNRCSRLRSIHKLHYQTLTLSGLILEAFALYLHFRQRNWLWPTVSVDLYCYLRALLALRWLRDVQAIEHRRDTLDLALLCRHTTSLYRISRKP